MNMYFALGILMTTLGLACSRDTSKAFRSMPAISNSLVNLGKMDISFHFNAKTPESQANPKSEHYTHSASPFFVQKPEPVQQTVDVERFEPCPCSSIKNFKNPFMSNSPSDMLGKILKSNDLFSFNQEPVVSSSCCDSHEHVQEDTVFFDFSPRNHVETPMQSPMSSFMLDTIIPKLQSPMLGSTGPLKGPKAIEILFFPKNKESFIDLAKLSPPKDKKSRIDIKSEIQFVGDKDLKNEFRNIKYRPSFPILSMKDSNLTLEQKDTEEKKGNKSEIKSGDKGGEKKDTVNGKAMKKSTPAPFTASAVQHLI